MSDLVLDQLAVTVAGKTLLHPLSTSLAAGRIIAVVGANGAGKTTLFRAIAALLPIKGAARFGDRDLAALHPLDRARTVAYLPQSPENAWPMPVRAMVSLGRYAFGDELGSISGAQAVEEALNGCGIAHLADRPVDRLSGGEAAMAALARVLVTECPVLLLDEPAAALDIGRQYQLLEHLAALASTGRTLLIILHDLSLVSQFADRILWLEKGRLVADTPNSRDAIDAHAARLLGRGPAWANDKAGLYFSRI